MLAPNADMVGHLTGMACAPLLKYFGFMELRLLPRYIWIKAFEEKMYDCTKAILDFSGYYYGTEDIQSEFACFLCKTKKVRQMLSAREERLRAMAARRSNNLGTDRSDTFDSEISGAESLRSAELQTMPIGDDKP